MSYEAIKQRVFDATLNLYHVGLIRLSAGNISTRINDHLLTISIFKVQLNPCCSI